LINESGLKIFSIDDLQSAAEKAVQFSKVVKMGGLLQIPHRELF
jgi:succinyl-CoA synthetase beta subunit